MSFVDVVVIALVGALIGIPIGHLIAVYLLRHVRKDGDS